MKRNLKRLIAMLCALVMVCSVCLSEIPVSAEEGDSGTTDITLDNAPEKDFAWWTFSDVGIEDQTLTDNSLWNNKWTNGKSLDKTLFNGKIKFVSKDEQNGFGQLYIGGLDESSKYCGFQFIANGSIDTLTFGFYADSVYYDASGNTHTSVNTGALAVFNEETAGAQLQGNEDLEVSLSVEYTDVTKDNKVTMKVGVFFDGKLYDNTYYTVTNVPEEYLKQAVRFYPVGTNNAIASHSLADITLETIADKNFEYWTFSDVGISDGTLTDGTLWDNKWTNNKSLDKTIFNGKMKFVSKDTTYGFGQVFIGGLNESTQSKYCGFQFSANGSMETLTFGFYADSVYYDADGNTHASINTGALAVFDAETAGTQLQGNEDLQVSISVEYTDVTDGKVTAKVGVFFDGKLYDNTYYTVKNIPQEYLKQAVRINPAGTSNAIASCSTDITLRNAPEKDFTYWTFSDVGISDQTVVDRNLWDNTLTNGKSMDKTIFNGKVNFAKTSSLEGKEWNFGNMFIGGVHPDGETGTKYCGFLFEANGSTETLTLGFYADGVYYNANGDTYASVNQGALAVFNAETAGVTLRGNSDLQLSISVEYVDVTDDGKVTMKVGVFFDGKLYDNTYYTVKNIPEAYLKQAVRFKAEADTDSSVASLQKAVNVAAGANGAAVTTSHFSLSSENINYGTASLIDGIVGQNVPYYLGTTSADLQNEPMTLEFAFDNVYSIDSIRMYKRTDVGGFPVDFTLDAYTAEGWKTVVSKTNYPSVFGWNEFVFDAVECTAVRLVTKVNGADVSDIAYGVHLSEFEVYGVTSTADVAAPNELTQVAVPLSFGKNSTAITDGTYVGNDGYRILKENKTDKVDIQLMLDRAIEADGITFYSQEGGKFPSAFDIYAFTGSTWEQVYSTDSYVSDASRIMHEFTFSTPVSCNSIMVVVNELYNLYGRYGLQLQEVRVNGVESEGACALLGDGNVDGLLKETEDLDAMRQSLVGTEEAAEIFNINMDDTDDVRDLVRLKRYFAIDETITKIYDITSMSFNVLGVSAQSGMQDPTVRAPKIAEYILAQDLDLVGLQEAGYQGYHILNKPDGYDSYEDYNWTTDFAKLICDGGYAAIKISDDSTFQNQSDHYTNTLVYGGGNVPISAGLMMFYKTSRFELLESGAQKYTSTESQERWFQWAKLQDRQSGEIVYMTNTHWSIDLDADGNVSETAGDAHRTTQANELLAFWKNTVGDNLLVATGDYNCASTSTWLQSLGSDIYKEAGSVMEVFDTLGSHIDHIFVNTNQASVDTCYFTYDNVVVDGTSYRYSDHYPIFVRTSYQR